jgi:glycosyltransferase involved in cell wall biosynthesis
VRIHQIGSVLSSGDAVTNHIIEIDRRLCNWGFTAGIYGSNIVASPTDKARPDAAYAPYLKNTEDVLLYHYSAYCDNHILFRRSRNRKILVYHNITPAEYFHVYDGMYEALCNHGRRVLAELTECDLALGVSEYNRQELISAGFAAARTGVLPLFLGVQDFENTPRTESLYRDLKFDGMTNVLFVGKVAPNKAFEDLIKIFYNYRRHVNRHARLILVGARFLPRYDRALDELVAHLDLTDAVVFTNRVPFCDLKTYYAAADLFLCASRHEGFCAPLLEAMYFDLPILARAETGVPYTLGQAGVQFHALDYALVAEMMDLLTQDEALRRQVIATQRRRLDHFAPARVESRLREVLQSVGVSVPGNS